MKTREWKVRIDSVYQAIGCEKEANRFWQALESTRRLVRSLFWGWVTLCLALLVSLAYFAHKWVVAPTDKPTTLFSGPPEFITLAVLMALAAYLRLVRGEALKSLESLRAARPWPPPFAEAYSHYLETRTAHLDDVVKKLSNAGPFVVWLFFLLALRILADTLFRLFGLETWNRVFYIVDFVIALWIVVAFGGLVTSHRIARNRDDDIRAIARYCEEKQQPEPVASTNYRSVGERQCPANPPRSGKRASSPQEGSGALLLAALVFVLFLLGISNRHD